MSAPSLMLIGAKDETVDKAVALGLEVVLLQHPAKVTPRQKEVVTACHIVDYTDWAEVRPLIESIAGRRRIGSVLSLTEAGVENAGRANDLLGLGGTGYVVARRFRDKAEMRSHLERTGFDTVAHAHLGTRADLEHFASRNGFPFVVKPVDATAGVGVMVVAGDHDLGHVWEKVRALKGSRTNRGSTLYTLSRFVMESYLEGPEFSVETMSYQGRHVVLAITEKYLAAPGTAEVGHAVPARVPRDVQDEIKRYVRSLLSVMGLRDGPGHTEVRLGPTGPRVIEAHNRPGGGAIPSLVRAVTGVDQAGAALAAPFMITQPLPGDPPATGGAASRFLASDGGVLRSIEGFEPLRACPEVLVAAPLLAAGQCVGALRDNWDRVGMVAVKSADPGSALALGEELLDEHVRVELTSSAQGTHRAYVVPLSGANRPNLMEVAQ
ncbi:MAG TPA: ATP-grasp domain-containing protein [Acidimicrobiales bacterium]|nr:ATP-grasp domain-containing protein [Acidimicrobiales bacterium]